MKPFLIIRDCLGGSTEMLTSTGNPRVPIGYRKVWDADPCGVKRLREEPVY